MLQWCNMLFSNFTTELALWGAKGPISEN